MRGLHLGRYPPDVKGTGCSSLEIRIVTEGAEDNGQRKEGEDKGEIKGLDTRGEEESGGLIGVWAGRVSRAGELRAG